MPLNVPAAEGVALGDVGVDVEHTRVEDGQRTAAEVRHLGTFDGHDRILSHVLLELLRLYVGVL